MPLDVERLETRTVPSTASFDPLTNTLYYAAAAGEANILEISELDGSIVLLDAKEIMIDFDPKYFTGKGGAGNPVTLKPEYSKTLALIDAVMGDLDDTCTVLLNINSRVEGNDGDDYLEGGGGNDTLIAGDGADTLDGGDGDDRVLAQADGAPLVIGNKVLSGGKNGKDELIGGAWDDIMFGFAGDDLLIGNGGHDLLVGGTGNDQLRGGDGNDTLRGEGGDDDLLGGIGNDLLYGGADNDALTGGDGFGGDGNDTLYGEGGNDNLQGGNGEDSLDGGSGNDTVFGGENNDTLIGGTGVDDFYGGGGDDVLDAADGAVDAVIEGGLGADTFLIDIFEFPGDFDAGEGDIILYP